VRGSTSNWYFILKIKIGGDEGRSLSQVGKMREKIDLFFSAVNQLE